MKNGFFKEQVLLSEKEKSFTLELWLFALSEKWNNSVGQDKGVTIKVC
jgi:hypothetical protein